MGDILLWFLSTIVAAFFINILSSYAKPWIDVQLGKVSSKIRFRNIELQKQLDEKIIHLLLNREKVLSLRFNEIYHYMRGVVWTILGVSSLILFEIVIRNYKVDTFEYNGCYVFLFFSEIYSLVSLVSCMRLSLQSNRIVKAFEKHLDEQLNSPSTTLTEEMRQRNTTDEQLDG